MIAKGIAKNYQETLSPPFFEPTVTFWNLDESEFCSHKSLIDSMPVINIFRE